MKRKIFTFFTLLAIVVTLAVLLYSCSRYTNIGDAASTRFGKTRNVR